MVEYLHQLFVSLLHERYIYTPLFIYSVICLYKYELEAFILCLQLQYHFILLHKLIQH